jgi:uncharacterized protein YggU (UPF0235/DUF167 family)
VRSARRADSSGSRAGETAGPVRIDPAPDGAALAVRVIPRAGQTRIAGTRDGALLVRLAAAPVDGAANDALIELLADVLQVSRRAVRLAAGGHSRTKRLVIAGVSPDTLRRRLSAILGVPPSE